MPSVSLTRFVTMPTPHLPSAPVKARKALVVRPSAVIEVSAPSVREARRRRRRWALFWAVLIHAAILVGGALWHTNPEFIAQIGTAISMSTEPAVDRQQESTEEKPIEEVVIQSASGPPPKPTEASIPDLVPVMDPVDLRMPEPSEANEFIEMDIEVVDLGVTFGEAFEGEDIVNEVLETKLFSAPAKGNCSIFVIDVSTSMPKELGVAGIAGLRRELRLKIDSLPGDRLFNIICFGDQADGLALAPIRASQEHKALAHRFMAGYFTGQFLRTRTGQFGRMGLANGIPYVPIQPSEVPHMKGTRGGSRYDLALVAAFKQRASTVYLVTDGTPSVMKNRRFLPGASLVGRDEVIRTVVRAGQRLYPKELPIVHCVSINGIGESYLKQIALAFKGRCDRVDVEQIP